MNYRTSILDLEVASAALVSAAGLMRSNGFVWHIAGAAFDAVVDADLTHRAERFVIKSGDTQRGKQFFVEPSQIFEMRCERGQFQSVVSQQEFLIACIPQPREPAL